ncbi:Gfo/Idh/MocA family protein [Streptomyces paludis]|uniref:Gfo/Idh/MocA family oxidoreductase n=1 Tax=Streptomyces paludis TaxID=2282738 RepID=A0A345HYC5_9ACTN|nr:Gfo/Idh/MocA family oxidoreductase [Streptomyces paludis]AXG81699.1 gfo/Idh/MocA family oxidoreductase [Streptomyces paludis]
MTQKSIGVAVIGAGMAGRAHLNGYRTASTLYEAGLPEIRLVAVADAYEPFARDAARRYGFERAETDWRAIAAAPDIDAVSVVVANHLHREIVEGLLAAGKHVLCEKPLAPGVADAQAMTDAAAGTGLVAATGFTCRRSPSVNAIRREVTDGTLGRVQHFNGHYWCDYGHNPDAPMSWRYKGGIGSGALSDIGSHLIDLGEYFCGPVESVRGAVLSTQVPDRPVPLGTAVGHSADVAVGDRREAVENEDIATFTALFRNGAVGTFSVSRVAFGLANALGFEVFSEGGAALFDLSRPAEFTLADTSAPDRVNGYRRVVVGPEHPYIAGGLPMDFPSVGHGQHEFFVWQARSFLEEIAGLDRLPRCATFAEGLHNLRVIEAITASAHAGGKSVTVQ